MKGKEKVECPVCGLIVALNTNGTVPRHKARWVDGPNRVGQPACFASGKPMEDVVAGMKAFNEEMLKGRNHES